MVGNVTSLTNNGLRDWLIQRVSAVILLAYSLFILGFLITHPQLTYIQWHGLFNHVFTRVFSLIAILSILLHTWIGIWTVTTDYVKCTILRLTLQFIIFITLLCLTFWSILIIWSL